jgi:hypothetical protein
MSCVLTELVAKAIAGGVFIGRLIASEQAHAIRTAPTIGYRELIAVTSGIIKLAAEVLLMKREISPGVCRRRTKIVNRFSILSWTCNR